MRLVVDAVYAAVDAIPAASQLEAVRSQVNANKSDNWRDGAVQIGTVNGMKVLAVNGDTINRTVHMDFVDGDNGAHNAANTDGKIPGLKPDEIIVDAQEPADRMRHIIVHEAVEAHQMQRGADYATAHPIANAAEREFMQGRLEDKITGALPTSTGMPHLADMAPTAAQTAAGIENARQSTFSDTMGIGTGPMGRVAGDYVTNRDERAAAMAKGQTFMDAADARRKMGIAERQQLRQSADQSGLMTGAAGAEMDAALRRTLVNAAQGYQSTGFMGREDLEDQNVPTLANLYHDIMTPRGEGKAQVGMTWTRQQADDPQFKHELVQKIQAAAANRLGEAGVAADVLTTQPKSTAAGIQEGVAGFAGTVAPFMAPGGIELVGALEAMKTVERAKTDQVVVKNGRVVVTQAGAENFTAVMRGAGAAAANELWRVIPEPVGKLTDFMGRTLVGVAAKVIAGGKGRAAAKTVARAMTDAQIKAGKEAAMDGALKTGESAAKLATSDVERAEIEKHVAAIVKGIAEKPNSAIRKAIEEGELSKLLWQKTLGTKGAATMKNIMAKMPVSPLPVKGLARPMTTMGAQGTTTAAGNLDSDHPADSTVGGRVGDFWKQFSSKDSLEGTVLPLLLMHATQFGLGVSSAARGQKTAAPLEDAFADNVLGGTPEPTSAPESQQVQRVGKHTDATGKVADAVDAHVATTGTGTRVVVHADKDSMAAATGGATAAVKGMAGTEAPAAYDPNTDTIHIDASHPDVSAKAIPAIFAHEDWTHNGGRKALGDAKFDEFTEGLGRQLTPAERNAIANRWKFKNDGTLMQNVGEEHLATLAESTNLGGAWKSIADKVVSAYNRAMRTLGATRNYSMAEVREVLRKGADAVKRSGKEENAPKLLGLPGDAKPAPAPAFDDAFDTKARRRVN